MSKYIRSILLLLCCVNKIIPLLAQDTAGYNRINLSCTPQYYFNQHGVKSDGKEPGFMRAANTFGYYFGLEYERTTRYGLVINAGVRMGMKENDISIVKNMINFIPNAYFDPYQAHLDLPKLYYVSPGFLIGYRRSLNKQWAIAAKAGIYQVKYLNGLFGIRDVYYLFDDQKGNLNMVWLFNYTVNMGKHQLNRRPDFDTRLFYWRYGIRVYSFYLGIDKLLDKRFMKNISVGIEGTMVAAKNETNIMIRSSPYLNSPDLSYIDYVENHVSLGLKMSVGLWK